MVCLRKCILQVTIEVHRNKDILLGSFGAMTVHTDKIPFSLTLVILGPKEKFPSANVLEQ
jgi:hypothetical protein